MIKIISLIFLSTMYLFAANLTVTDIIKKVEDNLNGKSAKIDITMIVQTKKSKRTMKMLSISQGTNKSFIKVLYPKKDKGITFLKLDNTMWQYVPKIERIIKIPASMMLQSWMGSDFSNDDLVKESSILKDYHHKILSEDENIYKLELLPKEDSTVVWGRLIMGISKKYFLPTSVEYFDEDEALIRILYYKDIKKLEDRYYPTYWEMIPKTDEKIGHKTIIKIENAVFDKEIESSYFTKHALKRYSE